MTIKISNRCLEALYEKYSKMLLDVESEQQLERIIQKLKIINRKLDEA